MASFLEISNIVSDVSEGRAADFKTPRMQIVLKTFIMLFAVASQLLTNDQGRALTIDAKQIKNALPNTGNYYCR